MRSQPNDFHKVSWAELSREKSVKLHAVDAIMPLSGYLSLYVQTAVSCEMNANVDVSAHVSFNIVGVAGCEN